MATTHVPRPTVDSALRPRLSPRAMAKAGGLHPFGVLVLLAGAFLPIADFFIVNVALPTIDRTLHASGPTLELIVAGYGVAYASVLVLGGRLGDRYGRHRLFLWGLVAFILASLACGLSPTIWVLIGARIVQGAAAAMLVPQVLATCHATLEGERKARALALYGATSGIAAVIGQLAGGILVHADIAGTAWRPIFLINIPLGLLVLALARRVVPATRSEHPAGIDLPGTLLFGATLIALLVPLTEGHELGWPAWTWIMLALAPTLAITTFRVEQRSERRGVVPLLPPSVLRLPSMWRGLAMLLPFSVGFGAFMFVFALTTQDGLHYNALKASLAILPMAVLFLCGSILSPTLIGRYGRGAMAAGGAVQAIGLALIITVILSSLAARRHARARRPARPQRRRPVDAVRRPVPSHSRRRPRPPRRHRRWNADHAPAVRARARRGHPRHALPRPRAARRRPRVRRRHRRAARESSSSWSSPPAPCPRSRPPASFDESPHVA